MPITLDGTKGETFPSWTTATRPASPVAGQTGFNTTTGALETYDGSNWGITPSTSSQGTSGQYLQSNGAGADPTWATLSTSGTLIRAPQILTSGTSYTTPSNCTAILVELLGGGGGGGSTSPTNNFVGGSGAAGAYAIKYFTVTGNTAYTYAIGGAGTGGIGTGANAGTAGGNTTFTVGGTTVTATGGTAGAAGSSTTAKTTNGVTATNGDFNGSSMAGISASTGAINIGGSASPFGSGGTTVTLTGGNATGYGSGGGGAIGNTSGNYGGGSGTQGFIRIWEFT